MEPVKIADIVGNHDWLFIVLDTLRYDVAEQALSRGLLPNLAHYLPNKEWQCRHSPATFTYPAHHAFFSGFLPTPILSNSHKRLFASHFLGSESISEATWVFEQATVIEALAARNYHTACIGGVGFFNKQNAIGSIFPDLFAESHWNESTGVSCQKSTENQVTIAKKIINDCPDNEHLFLFINVSALHQPNYFYKDGASIDSVETQISALAYVDQQLAPLFSRMQQRNPTFCIVCSDHGTCYGEDGYSGHRLAHDMVMKVPYAHFFL